jgi:hypothetical protein
MRLHIILNMPAVLSIYRDWKARAREREREGRNSAEVGNPQEIGTTEVSPTIGRDYERQSTPGYRSTTRGPFLAA